ncbi:MAG: hypothetical protein WCK55_07765 [Verrucomicrobiota bacterium]
MNSIRFRFALLLGLLLLVSRIAGAETPTVTIGGTIISLPPPVGFFRYDGKSSIIDKIEQRLLPASNRLLAAFGSEETLAEVLIDHIPKIERHFSAQSVRELESLDVPQAGFAEMRPGIRDAFTPQSGKYSSIIKELESNASSISSAVLKIGEMIPLRIFDDTKESICFSMLCKVQVDTIPRSYVSIVAGAVVRVRNRIFYLYASVPYHDKADIEWARRSVQQWRDDVLKANSR